MKLRVLSSLVIGAVLLAAVLAVAARQTTAQGNIDLSGSDWQIEITGAVSLSCTANLVQNAGTVSVQMDCPALGIGNFSGTIDQKSGAFAALGRIIVPVSLSGTATTDGQSFSGTWDAGFIGSGTFTGTRGASSTPTPTPVLPTLPAPVDLTGTWRVTFSSLFSGECTSFIQQDGTSLTSIAECDIIGSLHLTGTINQTNGSLTLGENGFVELRGVASADGNSIAGTFSALDIVTGTFTAQRDDSIELIDLSGDWRLALEGSSTKDCTMHIDQSFLDATAHVDCPTIPGVDLTGSISPLRGSFDLGTASGREELYLFGGAPSGGGYLIGDWYGPEDEGSFVAVPQGQDQSGVLTIDCTDYPGIQNGCGYMVGESVTVQLHVAMAPAGGYSGFRAQVVWPASILSSGLTGIPDCSTANRSVEPGVITLECDQFSSGLRLTSGPVADFEIECNQAGDATLDLSGTILLDSGGQPIEPLLIDGELSCYREKQGGPGLGDASCDGFVNSIDAALVLQHEAGLLPLTGCLAGADVNFDDQINSIDAALILQCTAGLTDVCSSPVLS